MFREQLNRLGQKHLNAKVLQDLQGGLMDGLHPILRENTLRLKRIFQDRPTVCRAGQLLWFYGVSWLAPYLRLGCAQEAACPCAACPFVHNGAWMRAIFHN